MYNNIQVNIKYVRSWTMIWGKDQGMKNQKYDDYTVEESTILNRVVNRLH